MIYLFTIHPKVFLKMEKDYGASVPNVAAHCLTNCWVFHPLTDFTDHDLITILILLRCQKQQGFHTTHMSAFPDIFPVLIPQP